MEEEISLVGRRRANTKRDEIVEIDAVIRHVNSLLFEEEQV